MEFIETPTFTKLVSELLTDEDYTALQFHLARNPGVGRIIRGSGGLRKIRWAAQGRGKSGGVRVIYYWMVNDSIIWMFLVYPKSEKDNLTAKEVARLKILLEYMLQ